LRCSLDDAPFAACSSPQPFHALAPRPHTFAARGRRRGERGRVSGDADVDGRPGGRRLGRVVAERELRALDRRPDGRQRVGGGGGGREAGVVGARVSWAAGEDFFFGALSPPPVPVAAASPYQAAGWVRSETAGEYVCLVLREWDGPVYVRQALQCLTATTDWQAWPPVALLTPAAGHQLDVYTTALNAEPGDSYDVDGLTVTAG